MKRQSKIHTHTSNIRRNNSSARFRVLFGLAWKNSVNLHSMAALKWIMNGDADKPLLIMTCLIHIQTSTQCHQYHTILRHKCAGKAIHEPFCLHSEVTFGCVSHSFVCLFFPPSRPKRWCDKFSFHFVSQKLRSHFYRSDWNLNIILQAIWHSVRLYLCKWCLLFSVKWTPFVLPDSSSKLFSCLYRDIALKLDPQAKTTNSIN